MRKVLLASVELGLESGQEKGGILMDALPFDSVEQLLLLAGDRVGWREAVVALLPVADPGHPEAQARKKKKKDSKGTVDSGCGLVDGKLAQVF